MTFEESVEDLTADVASLGFDLPALIAQKKIVVDYVHLDRHVPTDMLKAVRMLETKSPEDGLPS
jgi:hypothetical protein